jgi:hypothetical protein
MEGEADLIRLIEMLENTEAVSWQEAQKRYRARQEAESRLRFAAAPEDKVHIESIPRHEMYNQTQRSFSALLRSNDNELSFHVEKLAFDLGVWFEHWEHPPPHFPWRITVILRKAKQFDLERRFLAAYLKHLYVPRGGSTDLAMYTRAEKIGILTISDEDRLRMFRNRNPLVQLQLADDGDGPYVLMNCRMCGSISVKMSQGDGPVKCADCNAFHGTKAQLAELAAQFLKVEVQSDTSLT